MRVCGSPGQKLPSSHALYADASVVRCGSTAGIANAGFDATGATAGRDAGAEPTGDPAGAADTGWPGITVGITADAPEASTPPIRADAASAMARR
jgi:hypothetical protein